MDRLKRGWVGVKEGEGKRERYGECGMGNGVFTKSMSLIYLFIYLLTNLYSDLSLSGTERL